MSKTKLKSVQKEKNKEIRTGSTEWLVAKALENPRAWISEISERNWFKVNEDTLEKWVDKNLPNLYLQIVGVTGVPPPKERRKIVKTIVKEMQKNPQLYLAW